MYNVSNVIGLSAQRPIIEENSYLTRSARHAKPAWVVKDKLGEGLDHQFNRAISVRNDRNKWISSTLASILFHVALFSLIFYFFVVNSKEGGGGKARQTDSIAIAITEDSFQSQTSSLQELHTDIESYQTQDNVQLQSFQTDLETISDKFLPSDSLNTATTRTTASSQASSSDGGRSSDPATGQSVGFGDLKGKGQSFVYVIDRSASMKWGGGAPMRHAIGEAINSVSSLDSRLGARSFQVLAFNDDVVFWKSAPSLQKVTLENKESCVRFLKTLAAEGGTAPEKALEAGLRLRPDVIFFLTDADEELSEQSLIHLRELRRQYNVKQINVIEFARETDPVKKSFKRLAGENGGVYAVNHVETMVL